ncbi:Na(+)/H(+) exchange regulatory cofactor NHE-RF2-like [Oncorhynchus keta]|uniref:Na(+)/H(+) exchange regulatory cofactor NHE-RF2-like n=1 Tax=Oncorhynchus keta TaxID=8018 RepID=UPI00227A37BC|nr:Na(+)/H(+) exchange regulatory cofactor NHE-RF2-like [Oncorhynchus keta]
MFSALLTIFKNKIGLKSWTAGEMASELKPRLCIMTKSENGYGFHLHGEKGKNGQFIRKVEPASSAEASGLRPGDRVIEVNGGNVEKDTHHQVVQRIKAVEHETRLLVVDRETDEYLRSLRLVCTEEMAVHLGDPPRCPLPHPQPHHPLLAPGLLAHSQERERLCVQAAHYPDQRGTQAHAKVSVAGRQEGGSGPC